MVLFIRPSCIDLTRPQTTAGFATKDVYGQGRYPKGVAPLRQIGYPPRMRRDEALATLRAHEAELRHAGVVALSVFGSVARDDAGAASDVDVLVRFDDAVRRSGFRYFGQLAALGEHLRDILGTEVDVVAEPVHKERLRTAIARDRVVAF